jgi:hypothetical protein
MHEHPYLVWQLKSEEGENKNIFKIYWIKEM